MENARKFLARAVPWPTGQDDWWVSIHWGIKRGDRKGISFGRAFKDLDRAAYLIEFLRDKPGSDMYVSMSGISVVEQFTDQNGKVRHRAQRLAQNAAAVRSLWLDVDVMTDLKPKGFRSSGAALDAFGRFLQASGMPAPTFIVMTGSGGFHAHWVLEDPISVSEWLPLAHALVAATRHFAFIPLDTSLVINPVCLLRIPDTFNWKTDPPKPVWMPRRGQLVSLTKIKEVLGPFTNINEIKIQSPLVPGQSALGAAFAPRAPLPFDRRQAYPELSFQGTIDDVGVTCPFIAETLRTHGEGLREPVWFESLKVAYYTRDPLDAAHRLSSGHDGYDPEETEEKLGHVEKDRQRRDLGWPQCQTIRDAGAEQCPTCPHLPKGQSPLNFVTPSNSVPPSGDQVTKGDNSSGYSASTITLTPPPAATAKPDFGKVPPPYYHDKQGLVWRPGEATDEDPNPASIKIAPLPIIDLTAQRQRKDKVGEYAVHFETQLDRTNVQRIYVPYANLNNPQSLFGQLDQQGFNIGADYHKPFRKFMSSFTEQLFAAKLEATPSEMLGWSFDGESEQPSGFVYGRMRYNCTGDRVVASPDQQTDAEYCPTGALDRWKQAARLGTQQKNPALDALLAVSFGAPLVLATGHSGMVINAYSMTSGNSKSTICRIGQAVWSNPTVGLGGAKDTENFLQNKIATSRDLPVYVDDWQTINTPKQFVSLLFGMGQGRSKGRLNRSSQARPVSAFHTLLGITSNTALVELVAEHTKMTEAGAYRLFEFEVPKNISGQGMLNIAEGAQQDRLLDTNYGWPGKVYSAFLGKNVPKVFKEVQAFYRTLVERLKATQSERFWIATITVLYMGARYANQLELTEIDLDALLKFLVDQLHLMRGERSRGSQDFSRPSVVLGIVGQFISAKRQQTVVTEYLWDQPGRPPVNYDSHLLSNHDRLQGRLAIRAARSDKKLRISKSEFCEWLSEQSFQPRAFIKSLFDQQLAKEVLGTITARTTIAIGKTSQEKLLDFNLTNLPFLFNFDD